MAAGSSLTVIAYTSTKSNTRTLSIPNGNPINLVQGKLNRFTVNMSTATEADRYFSGGNGTAISPWRIATTTDLANLSSYVAEGNSPFRDDYYLQTADIDFNNGWLDAIGSSNDESKDYYFEGDYDGNGYKVSNVKPRNQLSNKAVGFFGYLSSPAHINRLRLDGVTIAAGAAWNAGAVAGIIQPYGAPVIENCVVTNASISGSSNSYGGILGKQMRGTVRNCSFSGTVSSTNTPTGENLVMLGGIVGQVTANTCVIDHCTFSGSVTSSNGCGAGGIVGLALGTIQSCKVASGSSISVKTGQAGGIFGRTNGTTTVNLCSASCNVTSTGTGAYGWVGGIGGYVTSTDLLIANCCYWSGTLSNKNGTRGDVAGIVGCVTPGSGVRTTICNCCAFPTKVETGSSNANIAGICGFLQQATVRNCYCPTAVSAFDYNGSTDGSGSRGSIYGWLRGDTSTQKTNPLTLAANLLDVYYLSTWKSGNRSGDWAYNRSEQSLTDTQMQNTGSVTRPSTSVSYDCFIDALNADVAAWNAGSPFHSVQGVTWVLGSNGYPVPSGLPQ